MERCRWPRDFTREEVRQGQGGDATNRGNRGRFPMHRTHAELTMAKAMIGAQLQRQNDLHDGGVVVACWVGKIDRESANEEWGC